MYVQTPTTDGGSRCGFRPVLVISRLSKETVDFTWTSLERQWLCKNLRTLTFKWVGGLVRVPFIKRVETLRRGSVTQSIFRSFVIGYSLLSDTLNSGSL